MLLPSQVSKQHKPSPKRSPIVDSLYAMTHDIASLWTSLAGRSAEMLPVATSACEPLVDLQIMHPFIYCTHFSKSFIICVL